MSTRIKAVQNDSLQDTLDQKLCSPSGNSADTSETHSRAMRTTKQYRDTDSETETDVVSSSICY